MKLSKTNNGKKGGLLKGKPHYDSKGNSVGGIKAIVTDSNRPVELEGGEVIINKHASKKYWRQLSKINQSAGGGVPIGNPNTMQDEDPEEYKEGGKVIEFNPNHLPNKRIYLYAKKIKSTYPKVWDKGGNIFGNEAFNNLQRVSERGYWLDSEKWMYIKWRSYVARHKQDFRINGVVAMLKWVDKVDKGWSYMKDLIEAEIDKKYPKKDTKFEDGGNVNKDKKNNYEGNKGFIKWFNDWYKSIHQDINITFSFPNKIAPYKEDNVVILDLFEKINQNIDAKQYMNEIIEKADDYDVTIYLEPKPRYKHLLNNAKKRKKISKEYLVGYYESFGFESTPNNKFMKRLPKMAKGGEVITYKNKFNKKYGFDKDESHSIKEISKISKIKLSSLQDIYNKGIGAYKTNPQSVRPNVKSKEQWAMARVYSAIMGGKASKVDANELSEGKMQQGGTFYTRTYKDGTIQKFSVEEYEKNVYPNLEKGGALYLAPNGRKSNLTPEQYKLVRTPEFKAWFGDWEKLALKVINDSGIDEISLKNISENVSKIVDENGEPKVMYHGARGDFNVFSNENENKLPWTKGGLGFYFTTYRNSALGYGTKIIEAFINAKNVKKSDESEHAFVSETDLFKLNNEGFDAIYFDGKFTNTKGQRIIKEDEIVVFEPNQIKLADGTNTTFDANNFDIRFKKGGSIELDGFTCEIIKNGERQIDAKSIEKLTKCINSLPQTKELNSVNGKYTNERIKLHNKIIKEVKKGVTCINKTKPIAVLMGGSPASGKTTFLKKYRPYLLQNNLFKVDADEIRAKLPEYKGWNASQTQKETSDIVKTLISDKTIGIPCYFDFIYDGTMTSVSKYESLIDFLKKEGYEIFIVFMGNISKNIVKERALKRYKKNGRFVPMEVIDDFFETGESTLNKLKDKVDGYIVVDASNPDYNIIQSKGKKLPNNRIYEKLGETVKLGKGGDVKSNNQLGDCYQCAGKMVMDYRGNNNNEIKFIGTPYLVHAEVSGQGDIEGIRYGHAFIVDDVFVYDYSNNRKIVLPKTIYFRIGKIIEKKPIFYKYTFEEAMKIMTKTMNYGPWDLKTKSGL